MLCDFYALIDMIPDVA